MLSRHFLFLAAALVSSCARTPKPLAREATSAATAGATPTLGRDAFNGRAVEHHLPLFWREDADGDQTPDADELAVLWGTLAPEEGWLSPEGQATSRLLEAMKSVEREPTPPPDADAAERRRRALVRKELAQSTPTLVESDFTRASAEDRALVKHVLAASQMVERLHALQSGVADDVAKLSPDDPSSKSLFHRNQGPQCLAPETEHDPDCSALPSRPRRVVGLYPAKLQEDPHFCERLAKEPNAAELMGHFSVVRDAPKGGFEAVPYHVAYREDMEEVARSLTAAAAVLSAEESAFQRYLLAAANAFRTGDWESANEAWAAMGVDNSKWYLRIAPDEVYYEPCAWKAGFAATFARINKESKALRQRLEPQKAALEQEAARLAGPPYRAREVRFSLPDFIDIIVNTGDARMPSGATVGQSLPNWGKVAERGGRTVAMTNLYTDADSQARLLSQLGSLLCSATHAFAPREPYISTVSTVLHEAAHNLGPSHEYEVKGKVDDVVFGGPLASMLEELKAQTAALYFSDWLAERGIFSAEHARRSAVRNLGWAFGQLSRGLYGGDGSSRPYPQLSAIQLGALRESGAIVWRQDEQAANGDDVGCFELDFDAWRPAVRQLAGAAFGIKSRGDRALAEKLKADFVDDRGTQWAKLREVITQRWLRAPKATFVYSVKH